PPLERAGVIWLDVGLVIADRCDDSLIFFFSSRRRHTRSKRDWSSDVCSSDLILKTSAIKMGNIDLLEVKSIVSEEVARAKTPLIKNSIIISRMNTPELVGASG